MRPYMREVFLFGDREKNQNCEDYMDSLRIFN